MSGALRALLAAVLGGALVPAEALAFTPVGTTATYYHPSLHGAVMANGARYNRWDPTIAACNWFPLGTLLKVTLQGTDRYIYVRVQDRGSPRLTLDLSEAGFAQLGRLSEGRIPIWIEVVTAAEAEPSDLADAPPDAPPLATEDEAAEEASLAGSPSDAAAASIPAALLGAVEPSLVFTRPLLLSRIPRLLAR